MMRRKGLQMTKIAYDPKIVDSYNKHLGKRRGQVRRQSEMGQMELSAMSKAAELGHVPGVGLDGKYESFLFCETYRCFAMCSITKDEGVHGSIVEVQCGDETIIHPNPKSVWEEGHEGSFYPVPTVQRHSVSD